MKRFAVLTALSLSFAAPAFAQSILTPAGNLKISKQKGDLEAARQFSEAVVQNPTNAAVRTRMLELMDEQIRTGRWHELSRRDFTLVLNMGLGWDDKLGPETMWYVHDFVNDMRSMGVKTVFLQRDPYGPLRANGDVISPQLKAVLDEGRPVIVFAFCKGSPELLYAMKQVVGPTLDGERAQTSTSGGRIVSYINSSGLLSGAFYSDRFSRSRIVRFIGQRMKSSKDIMRAEWGKTVLALSEMRTDVVDPLVAESLPGLPSDAFYLNVVGAPLDRDFMKTKLPLGDFFKLNDWLGLYKAANDGYLDITKIALPASVSANQATLTVNGSHIIADGKVGPYPIVEEFNRRAYDRALLEIAIERGIWESGAR